MPGLRHLVLSLSPQKPGFESQGNGQSVTGTSSSLHTLVIPSQHHSTSAPYSYFMHVLLTLQKFATDSISTLKETQYLTQILRDFRCLTYISLK